MLGLLFAIVVVGGAIAVGAGKPMNKPRRAPPRPVPEPEPRAPVNVRSDQYVWVVRVDSPPRPAAEWELEPTPFGLIPRPGVRSWALASSGGLAGRDVPILVGP